MTRTAPKKGAAGKFLALLASLTMIVVGLVGVAFAAPASASNNPAEVCAGYAAWARISADGTKEYSTSGITVGATGLPGKSGTWTSDPAAAVVYLHAGDGQDTAKNMGSGSSGEWGDDDHGISTLTFCYDTPPPPDTRKVYWCDGGEGTQESTDDFATWQWADGSATSDDWVLTPGEVDCDTPVYDASLTCSTWSASVELPLESDADVQLKAKAYDVEVFLDDNPTPIAQGDLVDGKWSGNGTFDAFADGKKHTLTVKVFGEVKKVVESEVCPVPACTANCGETVVETFSAPGGSDAFCSASGQTVTVTWDGVSGQGSQAQANEGAAFNKNNALNANGVPFGTEPGACAVAAAVALPATVVPAPAKKPVVVSAPKPAKVAGGVANIVSVPQAATVPAAVPAGDGSQAPGLPMWALALVAVGALGAAAAGKQILGARK